ncbi:hypothetical protein Tco_0317763 [Tanacetum coccineum]
MDGSDLTMEEYIKLEAKKARRHEKTFNWETATYGKVYCDEIDSFKDLETYFPSIVYNDASTSYQNVSSEPTVSIYNAIKADIDFSISFSDSKDEDYTVNYNKDSFSYKIIPVNDLKSEPGDKYVEINVESYMALPRRDQRHQYLRFEGLEYLDVDITYFEERLGKIYGRGVHRRWLFEVRGSLVHKLILEFFSTFRFGEEVLGLDIEMEFVRFGTYWVESARQIYDNGDLSAYWRGISSEGDFLGAPPSYTTIRDLMLRLCHRLITCNIVGRSQAPEKLVRLQICEELDKTWDWVAPGLERQPDVVAGGPVDDEEDGQTGRGSAWHERGTGKAERGVGLHTRDIPSPQESIKGVDNYGAIGEDQLKGAHFGA